METGDLTLEDEIRATERGLWVAGAGVVVASAGVVVTPVAGLLSVPFILVGMGYWIPWVVEDVTRKRKVTYLLIDSVSLVPILVTGHFVLCTVGLLMSQLCRRALLATRRRTRDEFEEAFDGWTGTVVILRGDDAVEVPLDALEVGDRVVVRAGQSVPCDGELSDGWLVVDERRLTGESVPMDKLPGSAVMADTMIVGGHAIVDVQRAGRETVSARLAELVRNTESFEQTLDQEMHVIADATTPMTLVMAGAGALRGGIVGGVSGLWSNCVEVAWVSSPIMALSLMKGASRNGILIKDGRTLTLLPEIDTIVFDKTGTLTLDTLRVVDVHPAGTSTADEVLRLAATAETGQIHPIAVAIRRAAEQAGQSADEPTVTATDYRIGMGLFVRVDGVDVCVGSRRLVISAGLSMPPALSDAAEAAGRRGRSTVFVGAGGRLCGSIELAPEIRPEASAVIEALRRRGIDPGILSGDAMAPTRALADQLGVERAFGEVLPEGKAEQIAALQAEGRSVCFVGDGVNDALAMRQAEVSVSLAGAASLAIDSAQILLRDGTLSGLDAVFDLGVCQRRGRDRLLVASAVPSALSLLGVLMVGLGPVGVTVVYAGGLATGLALAGAGGRWKPRLVEGAAVGTTT